MSSLRTRLYTNLDPEAWREQGISPLNRAVLGIVLLSILVAVLESEPTLRDLAPRVFKLLNLAFAIAFLVEYVVRAWAMGLSPKFSGVLGPLRYGVTFASLLDLIATLSLWVGIIFGLQGSFGVLLRLVRVLRVLTLTRNSQWASALRLVSRAVGRRSRELVLSFGLTGIVLLVSATFLFAVEGSTQPSAFGSIPRAMWWAMATLTTVGYGDVFPVTAVGKIFASVTALAAIGIVAMPAGILAAAFSDAFQESKGSTTGGGDDS